MTRLLFFLYGIALKATFTLNTYKPFSSNLENACVWHFTLIALVIGIHDCLPLCFSVRTVSYRNIFQFSCCPFFRFVLHRFQKVLAPTNADNSSQWINIKFCCTTKQRAGFVHYRWIFGTSLAKHYTLFLVILYPQPFFSTVEEINVFAAYHTSCFWAEFNM